MGKIEISFIKYSETLQSVLREYDWSRISVMTNSLLDAWKNHKQVFICGNGGSAANAMHMANDFLYGIAKDGAGMKVNALSSNTSVLTCLGNDLGYDEIFSRQLKVMGNPGDILVVLSGSGNSKNIINVLCQAKSMKIMTYAILGYDGGKCLSLVDYTIHFPVHDMQICEDLQLIVGHMIMQNLSKSNL